MILAGLRVLDLSRVVAGPYCALLLADLGADVIKIERPGRGDDLRHWRGQDGMSPVFAAMNRNKRSLALDLQHPDGARLALELAKRSDVVIENFLPGVADRLGVGYRAVSATNPAVVYASITGFGQDGPYARRAGYNTIAHGMSGLMALTGMPGYPPTKVGGSVSDLAAALHAFGVVNAALVHRFRTGRGQHLDISLLASTLGLLPDPVALFFASGGARPRREGNRPKRSVTMLVDAPRQHRAGRVHGGRQDPLRAPARPAPGTLLRRDRRHDRLRSGPLDSRDLPPRRRGALPSARR